MSRPSEMAQGARLTPEQIERVADALRKTPSWRAAADWSGINRRTLHKYQERAEAYAKRREADDENTHLPQTDDPDYYHWQAVQTWLAARSEGEMVLVNAWRAGAQKDWRAAQTFLRATFPKDYSEQVQITGADGGAIQISTDEARAALDAALGQLAEKREAAGESVASADAPSVGNELQVE